MLSFMDYFVIIIIIVFLFFWMKQHYGEVIHVKSNIDNREYLVLKMFDSQRAADTLALLNQDFQKLINYLMAKYPDNEDVRRLFDNYNPDAISEGSPDSGYTSYSVNKGEKIVICLRQKNDLKSFVDINTVKYVYFHECSHLACNEVGHTEKYWITFKWLLTEAVNLGLYKIVDYAKNPQKYCGITITSSIV